MARKNSTPKEKFFQRVGKLVEKGDWQAVRAECSELVDSGETSAEALFLMALAAFTENDIAGAVDLAKAAVEVDAKISEVADFLAVLHSMAGDLNAATYYAKLASTGETSETVSGWVPDSVPRFTEAFFEADERPFFRKAMLAASRGVWVDAEHWFRQHLAFTPGDAEAYAGLANSLMIQGLNVAAVEILRAARHSVPDDATVASLLASALTRVGQHDEAQSVHRWAKAARPDDAPIHASAMFDRLFDTSVDVQTIAADVAAWGRQFGIDPESVPDAVAIGGKRRLTIGYVVGTFDRSGPARALAEILAHHDAQRFRVIGFGTGQLSDTYNIVFQKCFETWIDTHDTDPLTFASIVAAEDVDILVDVSGFATPSLVRAFAARMAPVQLSWAGGIYGTGLANVDGLLTDAHLDPEGADEARGYAEAPLRLAGGAPIVELPLPGAAADEASSDAGPTFMADAMLTEINVPTVEAWTTILRAFPGSMLSLFDHDFRSNDATARLIGLFGNFGMAHRIDVISGIEAEQFFNEGDVCLMPYQSMRPEVAVRALSAGRPVVCWTGPGRHRRLVSSVLHHAGLADQMVADTAAAYADLAVSWMNDADRRAAFAASVRERLAAAPIFDAPARAADLERVYLEAWEAVCPETAES